MNRTRSAGLLIEIFGTGVPGQVLFEGSNLGPVHLNRQEVIVTLRGLADQMEAEPDDDGTRDGEMVEGPKNFSGPPAD